MHFWGGSLHVDNYEKKNIPYEPAYAQISMGVRDVECSVRK